eukprot:751268-Hanusia_phi.AAC.1
MKHENHEIFTFKAADIMVTAIDRGKSQKSNKDKSKASGSDSEIIFKRRIPLAALRDRRVILDDIPPPPPRPDTPLG